MKQTITSTISRTAMMLLVMVLTVQMAWADNIVITSANLTDYFVYNSEFEFREATSGTLTKGGYFLKETVAAESTLDFKGEFIPDGSKNPRIFFNKRLNITSSDKSAVFKSGDTGFYWMLVVMAGADYTEVKNLKFIDACLYVNDASYVTIDGVDMVANVNSIGAGTGFLSIFSTKETAHTDHAIIKNSHVVNGGTGSATVVIGCGGEYSVADNNVLEVTGQGGNILYATTMLGTGEAPKYVQFTNNVINNAGDASAICWGIIVSAAGSLIEGNTINYKGVCINTQMGASISADDDKIVYRNNTINNGGSMSTYAYSVVENNHVSGTLTINQGVTATCNSTSILTVTNRDANVQNNTVYGNVSFNSSASNTTFIGNTVNGSLSLKGNSKDNTIVGNAIVSSETYAINSAKTSTGNKIEHNLLISSEKQGDEAVNPAIGTDNTIQYNNGGTVITSGTSLLTASDNGTFYIVPANTTVTVPGNVSVSGSSGQRVNIVLLGGAALTINGQLAASNKTVGISALTNDNTIGKVTVNDLTYNEMIISSGYVTINNVFIPSGYYKKQNGSGATYSVSLTSEYSPVSTIYAGCQNYLTLEVENTSKVAGSNVVAQVLDDGYVVWEEVIENLPAGEKKILNVVDPTIRPVDEYTIIGNDNKNIVYEVIIKENDENKVDDKLSFVILYNGNLGKDYAYPSANPTLRKYSFIGDVQVMVGSSESYSASITSRDEVFAVDLNGGSVHKALLYVSYNWDKVAAGDFNDWTTAFNGNTIAPLASYRDQGNLGKYGSYGYGMVVYDVTAYVVGGDNTFAVQKASGNVALYPSSLIVMVENSSSNPKAVYIVEEADLLSKNYNKNVDACYNSSFKGVANGEAAKLYVFAAGAQAGEGDIVISDNLYENVWQGTSNSLEVYETPVESGDISVQFKATGSSLMALQQMLVVTPATTSVTIGGAGYTTHTASYNLDFSGFSDEVKAYVATGYDYDAGTIWLTRVKDVPAGTPIMVKGNASQTYDIPVKLTSGAYFKNMFVGNTTGNTITLPQTSGEMTNYYLSNGVFKTSTGTNTIGAGKCYLQIPTIAPTPVVGSGKEVTLNKNGFASFCANEDLDFSDVEGLKAYAATGYDDASGTIWLTRVSRVSAGTGLLLMGAASGNYTIPSTGVKSYYANMMVGNTGTSAITIYTTSGDMTNYYLSGNKLLKAAAAGTAGNTINPGKAYMQIPTKHVTRSIGDDPTENLLVYDLLEQPEVISMQVMTRGLDGDGDTTGIHSIEDGKLKIENDVYYNLQGQRVDKPTKGLYIRNGRKVVIK